MWLCSQQAGLTPAQGGSAQHAGARRAGSRQWGGGSPSLQGQLLLVRGETSTVFLSSPLESPGLAAPLADQPFRLLSPCLGWTARRGGSRGAARAGIPGRRLARGPAVSRGPRHPCLFRLPRGHKPGLVGCWRVDVGVLLEVQNDSFCHQRGLEGLHRSPSKISSRQSVI